MCCCMLEAVEGVRYVLELLEVIPLCGGGDGLYAKRVLVVLKSMRHMVEVLEGHATCSETADNAAADDADDA